MNVSLPPELESFVHQKLQAGQYGTASEVILEGLKLLKERDDLDRERLEILRRDVQVGIDEADAGRTVPLTSQVIEEIKARGQARMAARQGRGEA